MDHSENPSAIPEKPAENMLVSIRDLKTHFFTDEGVVKAVDGVSFDIPRGKTMGVVGESGCGKSVTAYSIMRLIPDPPGKIVSGEIFFDGRQITKVSEREMRRIRGNRISMIFQEPMTSLNPVYTVGNQVMEAIMLHQGKRWGEARDVALEFLEKVGIPSAELRIDEYPHQMSGGMKQRVMIAMALSCYPSLLIADEPTTALDVTIQAQILDLMNSLKDEFGMSILLITHDLGVVAEMADHVVVMYASKIAEKGTAIDVFKNPQHPYTLGLFKSIPNPDVKKETLDVIPGVVPNPLDFPSGCKFRTRCVYAQEQCLEEPELREMRPGHHVACWFAGEI
jgi:peptide/nickel transport system ATP-binding protein/oligopeptide transport system ATP-binding protein